MANDDNVDGKPFRMPNVEAMSLLSFKVYECYFFVKSYACIFFESKEQKTLVFLHLLTMVVYFVSSQSQRYLHNQMISHR